MPDPCRTRQTTPSDQLANLMSYTVFHIGAYIALAAAVIGVGASARIDHWSLKFATVMFGLAGLCGGVIASNIPHFVTFECFGRTDISWSWAPWLRCSWTRWAKLEHRFFWAGAIVPGGGFVIWGPHFFSLPWPLW